MPDPENELTGQPSIDSQRGLQDADGEHVISPRVPDAASSATVTGEDRKDKTLAQPKDKETRKKGLIILGVGGALLIWFLLSTFSHRRAAKSAPPDVFSRTPANNARISQLPLFAVTPPKNPSVQAGGPGTSYASAGPQEDSEIVALHRQLVLLQAMSALRQAQYQYDSLRVNPGTTAEQKMSVTFAPAEPSAPSPPGDPSSAASLHPDAHLGSSGSEVYATVTETAKADSGKQSVLRTGTLLDAVLVNKLATDNYTSPVITMVDRPYYDSAERRLLIPAGTRILGEAEAVKFQTASRLAITFNTFQFPDGRTFHIKPDESALEGIGVFGLADKVNRHTARILFTAGLVGILTGWNASQTQTGTYGQMSGTDQMRMNANSSVGNTAEKMLSPFLNAVPTITVNEGHRLKIYITRDLPLNYYEEGPRE